MRTSPLVPNDNGGEIPPPLSFRQTGTVPGYIAAAL
jgi:hypothetical protein